MKYFNQGVKTVEDIEYVDSEELKTEIAKPVQGPVEKPRRISMPVVRDIICDKCGHTNKVIGSTDSWKCLICGKEHTIEQENSTENKGILDKIKEKLS